MKVIQQIRLLDRDGNPCSLNVEDIVAIRPTADGPEFYTKDDMYFYPTTMEELQSLFKDIGFERLDRTNLVNLHHVMAFDPKARKVYYEYPYSKDSKFATVSEANVSKVEHLAKEQEASYKPARKPLFGKG
jgi:DNA-binding LytR/AlgR family response regulator